MVAIKHLSLLAAVVAATQPAQPTRVATPAGSSGRIPGRYIVRLTEAAVSNGRSAEQAAHAILGGRHAWGNPRSARSAQMASFLVVDADEAAANALRASSDVESVEQDSYVHTAALRMEPLAEGSRHEAPKRLRGRRLSNFEAWNAANDRADQRDLPVDSFFSYTSEGAGVDIYVLDSGIAAEHVEFDTRVETALAANFDNSSTSVPRWGDCAGHGTFVASQAAGNFVGMALSARIIPVRVFNCAGQASLSSLVSAVDYIITTAAAQGRKSVINFSGGGGASGTMDSLAARAWSAGLLWVDAAGNEAASACTKSPARSSAGLTVGALTPGDSWGSFSNFGACVNISAVGVQNIGAWPTGTNAYAQGDGTSFSAPIVAGVAAAIWSGLPAGTTNAQVVDVLLNVATAGVITGLPVGTTNLMAYNGGEAGIVGSPSGTPTPTASPASLSITPSRSATPSFSKTGTRSRTGTASFSKTGTRSRTRSIATTPTVSATATLTRSVTPSPTATRSASPAATVTPSGSPATTASASPTATVTPSGSPATTASASPAATVTPSGSPATTA